ncbi:MAG: iron-containing alcohol dehydrogenase [Candidatus Hodarchaeales archaeon]
MMLFVEVPRKVVYGKGAISKLETACESIGMKKKDELAIVSGDSATKRIAEEKIAPLIEDSYEVQHIVIEKTMNGISGVESIISSCKGEKVMLIACGGGRIMDMVKMATAAIKSNYISLPTSASHDGFSSPYIGFLLRKELEEEQEKNKESKITHYSPVSPIAIVGDTELAHKAPYSYLASGYCDLLAKRTAYADWVLANRLRGEHFDEHAAIFGLFSATMAEKGVKLVAMNQERGVRLVIKALGNSGVSMSLAGNSRPASGAEHLISHYMDLLSVKRGFKSSHGYQVGLATIITSYLHGLDWEKTRSFLKQVKAPVNARELGIDRDILLEALLNAHKIRPDRYTILGDGLNREAAENALDFTETG